MYDFMNLISFINHDLYPYLFYRPRNGFRNDRLHCVARRIPLGWTYADASQAHESLAETQDSRQTENTHLAPASYRTGMDRNQNRTPRIDTGCRREKSNRYKGGTTAEAHSVAIDATPELPTEDRCKRRNPAAGLFSL